MTRFTAGSTGLAVHHKRGQGTRAGRRFRDGGKQGLARSQSPFAADCWGSHWCSAVFLLAGGCPEPPVPPTPGGPSVPDQPRPAAITDAGPGDADERQPRRDDASATGPARSRPTRSRWASGTTRGSTCSSTPWRTPCAATPSPTGRATPHPPARDDTKIVLTGNAVPPPSRGCSTASPTPSRCSCIRTELSWSAISCRRTTRARSGSSGPCPRCSAASPVAMPDLPGMGGGRPEQVPPLLSRGLTSVFRRGHAPGGAGGLRRRAAGRLRLERPAVRAGVF